MPRKPSPNGGATTPRQFRFTASELAMIDMIAEHIRPAPDITITRTDILRAAIRRWAMELFSPTPGPAALDRGAAAAVGSE